MNPPCLFFPPLSFSSFLLSLYTPNRILNLYFYFCTLQELFLTLWALHSHSTLFFWCWGSNSRPCVCKSSVLPLSNTPNPFPIFKKYLSFNESIFYLCIYYPLSLVAPLIPWWISMSAFA
jgi:hypothetical protein